MLYAKKTEMEMPHEKFKIEISTRNQEEGFLFSIKYYKHFIFLLEYNYSTINTASYSTAQTALPARTHKLVLPSKKLRCLQNIHLEIKKTFCSFCLRFLFLSFQGAFPSQSFLRRAYF